MPPPPPDGGRPFADASVPKPDADLNDAMCVNTPLLMNAGYDDSTGTGSAKTVPNWTAATTADGGVLPGVFVRTSAELGTPYNTTMTGPYAAKHGGTGISGVTNRLCQDVTVPAGADTLRLSLSAWVTTQETTTTQRYDFLNFELTTTGGGALETIVTPIDNLMVHAQWTPFNFQAMGAGAPYAGQTIRFCALGVADPSLPTELRFDTLVLEAVDCP